MTYHHRLFADLRRLRFVARFARALVLGGALVNCSSDPVTGSGDAAAYTTLRVELVAGDGQTGPAGGTLGIPLRIRALTADGRPAANRVVNFRVVAGGGQVFAGASQTDADGFAAERWTLGTVAGAPQAVEVRTVDPVTGTATILGTFSARAVAAAPTIMERVSPDSQRTSVGTPVATPPTVRVLDRYRNAVNNTRVLFTQVPTGNAGGGPERVAVVTDSLGIAKLSTWILPTSPGSTTLRVAVDGSELSLSFIAFAVADMDPSRLPPLPRVASGGSHTCALTPSGDLFCWGSNSGGTLGLPSSGVGSVSRSATPRLIDSTRKYIAVVAGQSFSCGLSDKNDVYCWGQNAFGNLGTLLAKNILSDNPTPLLVDGGLKFARLSASSFQVCGLTLDGVVYCWGYGRNGEMGNGRLNDRQTPGQAALGLRFIDVTVGGAHACALQRDGRTYCWGSNAAFQLNYGSEVSRAAVALPLLDLPPLVAVTAGVQHTCGLRQDSTAVCWGGNADGQLGDGTGYTRSRASEVLGGHKFTQLVASVSHTCGLRADQKVFCWGGNEDASLGDGTLTTRVESVPLAGDRSYSALSGRCAMTQAAAIWCWGPNSSNQTGNPAAISAVQTPFAVPPPFSPRP